MYKSLYVFMIPLCLLFANISVLAQGVQVTGVISNNSGKAISGISVSVKGSTVGVFTDDRGRYSITAPAEDAVLQFSSAGFHTQEVEVRRQRHILVTMQPVFDPSPYNFQVTGVITDEKGEPMPGVSVSVKGATIGVVADINGNFSITAPNENVVLQFTFVDYHTQEIEVGDRRHFPITMVLRYTPYVPLRVDFGCWGVGASSEGAGLSLNIEPKYAISPQLSLGFKIEGNLLFLVGDYDVIYGNLTQTIVSYLATTDYYYGLNKPGTRKKRSRSFIGAGLGFYQIKTFMMETQSYSPTISEYELLSEGLNLGVMFRAGFDTKHTRFTLAYNYIGRSELERHSSGFFNMTLGLFFGGWEKK